MSAEKRHGLGPSPREQLTARHAIELLHAAGNVDPENIYDAEAICRPPERYSRSQWERAVEIVHDHAAGETQ